MRYANYQIVFKKQNGKISAIVTNIIDGQRDEFHSTTPGALEQALINNLSLDAEAQGALLEDIQGYFS